MNILQVEVLLWTEVLEQTILPKLQLTKRELFGQAFQSHALCPLAQVCCSSQISWCYIAIILGKPPMKDAKVNLLGKLDHIVSVATNTEGVHEEMENNNNYSGVYFRFNPELKKGIHIYFIFTLALFLTIVQQRWTWQCTQKRIWMNWNPLVSSTVEITKNWSVLAVFCHSGKDKKIPLFFSFKLI